MSRCILFGMGVFAKRRQKLKLYRLLRRAARTGLRWIPRPRPRWCFFIPCRRGRALNTPSVLASMNHAQTLIQLSPQTQEIRTLPIKQTVLQYTTKLFSVGAFCTGAKLVLTRTTATHIATLLPLRSKGTRNHHHKQRAKGSPVAGARDVLAPLADLDACPGLVLHVDHGSAALAEDDAHHVVRYSHLTRRPEPHTVHPFVQDENTSRKHKGMKRASERRRAITQGRGPSFSRSTPAGREEWRGRTRGTFVRRTETVTQRKEQKQTRWGMRAYACVNPCRPVPVVRGILHVRRCELSYDHVFGEREK